MSIPKNGSVGSAGVDRTGVAPGDVQADRTEPATRDGLADRNADIEFLTARARTLRNKLKGLSRSRQRYGPTADARTAAIVELKSVEDKLFALLQMPLFSWTQNDR